MPEELELDPDEVLSAPLEPIIDELEQDDFPKIDDGLTPPLDVMMEQVEAELEAWTQKAASPNIETETKSKEEEEI